MKVCITCQQMLPEESFWLHGKDGYLQSSCKSCQRELEHRRRQANPERYREKHLRFYSMHKTEIAMKRKERYALNKDKYKAQSALRYAIRKGKLEKQPCEVCGRVAEAHHQDYSKPFEVRWFCRQHHIQFHNGNL